MNIFRTFLSNENGATAIEYGLIAALVSLAAIGALTTMGDSLDAMFGAVSTELDAGLASASSGAATD